MTITVAIMSMQRIHNYGSSLQAYALRRLVEDVAGDVVISFADYRPGPVLGPRPDNPPTRLPLGRAAEKVLQYNDVDARLRDRLRFFNHKRRYAARYLPLIGVSKQPNWDLDVDVQIIGSDEVFNCVQSNANVGYTRDLFGHGSPARRIVSYAASFGNTTWERLASAGITDELAEDFARFAAISVRDRNSAQIVERLTGSEPLIHVDPALAFDFAALEPRVPPTRVTADRYLLVYGYSGRLSRAENAHIRRHARAIDAEIICLGGVQGCCDRFVDCDPFQLLALFRDAEAVVTDTFHGTIFSIVNRKPFGSIVRRSTGPGYGNQEKLGHLLETFGLAGQKVSDLAGIGEILNHPLDYDEVGRILARERQRTRGYLAEAISAAPM